MIQNIPKDALVVDVGGGANPLPRADYVIDGLAYKARGALRKGAGQDDGIPEEHWVTLDICEHKPWPFPDKYFDYANCTHVLEDVRDPVWVCSEIQRIAKAGIISTPSRIVEQSRGVEHPCYAGYYHHRWLVSVEGSQLVFRFKPHSLHVIRGAIVADVGPNRQIDSRYVEMIFEWSGSFQAVEYLCFDDQQVEHELCEYAASVRTMPGLTVPAMRSPLEKIKRFIYFMRLRLASHKKA